MRELTSTTEQHGTCFCFEPLGPKDTDFLHSVLECIEIVDAVGSKGLRTQIDAKALVANSEIRAEIFDAAVPSLVHVHANEADLGVLKSVDGTDHHAIGDHLRRIGYQGYVSVEQRMLSEDGWLADIGASVETLHAAYGD